MADSAHSPADARRSTSRSELSERLDGARDLYLLALALGERREGFEPFGRMIREARIHFEEVIEQARAAGLDTGAIATVLGDESVELADSIRPELRPRVEQLLADVAHHRTQR